MKRLMPANRIKHLSSCQSTQDQIERSFIIDGALIRSAMILTSGTYLSGYVILLGGSDFLVGLLDMAQSWAPIVAVFSFIIFERMSKRKPLLLSLLALSRLLVCLPVFLPLFFGKGPAVVQLTTVMVIASNMVWGFYMVGQPVWMMHSVQGEKSKAMIFRRNLWIRISVALMTIVFGNILDWSGKSYAGFLVVFLSGLAISAVDVAVMLRIPDVGIPLREKAKFTLPDFIEPFTHADFRRYLLFNFLFFASLMIASAFTSLYLIRYLQLDYKLLAIPFAISHIAMIASIRFWRFLESRIGMVPALRLSGLMMAVEFGLYAFLTRDTYFLLYIGAPLAGIGNSGFSIFTFNYRYHLMPEKNRTVYEGWYGAIFGISVLLGPILGNIVMKWLPDIQNSVMANSKFQLLFLLSFMLGMGALALGINQKRAGRKVPQSGDSADITD